MFLGTGDWVLSGSRCRYQTESREGARQCFGALSWHRRTLCFWGCWGTQPHPQPREAASSQQPPLSCPQPLEPDGLPVGPQGFMPPSCSGEPGPHTWGLAACLQGSYCVRLLASRPLGMSAPDPPLQGWPQVCCSPWAPGKPCLAKPSVPESQELKAAWLRAHCPRAATVLAHLLGFKRHGPLPSFRMF